MPRRPAPSRYPVNQTQWLIFQRNIWRFEERRRRLRPNAKPFDSHYQRLREKLNDKRGSLLDPGQVNEALERLIGLSARKLRNDALLQISLDNIIQGVQA